MKTRHRIEIHVGSEDTVASATNGVIYLGALLTAEEPVAEDSRLL